MGWRMMPGGLSGPRGCLMGGGEVGVLSKEEAGVAEGDLAQPCTIFLAACRCSQSQLERRGCCSVYACVTVFCVYMQL